jgi:HTH-type transcriptional regulator, competence development regulator
MTSFGEYIRHRRLELDNQARTKGQISHYSLRSVAKAVRIPPSYLCNIEGGKAGPSEFLILKLAAVLEEDSDVLLALAGKVPDDVKSIITNRPRLFAEFLRAAQDVPEEKLLQLVRAALADPSEP